MPPIADSSLGSRFWITSDFVQLGKFYGAEGASGTAPVGTEVGDFEVVGGEVGDVDSTEQGSVIGGDAALTSLANGDDATIKNVCMRAKLLAPGFTDANNPVDALKGSATFTLDKLGIDDPPGFVKKLARMNRLYQPADARPKGELTDDELKQVKVALAHMVMSNEFAARAHQGKPLTKEGRLALANATLGLMKLFREGKVNSENLSDFLQGEVVDLNKPGDVYRLAVKTAQKARETFVDEVTVRANFARVKAAALDAARNLPPDAQARAFDRLAELAEKVDNLIAQRKAASKILDLTYDVGDGKTGTIKDKIKDAREALRAFRYDLDRATHVGMRKMESFRRRMDDLGSTSANRVDAAKYQSLVDAEDEVNALMRHLGVRGGIPAEEMPQVESVADTSARATELTHATNNHIRYFFSGAESKREKFARETHAMFDPMVEKGGTKTVVFEAGADVRAGVKLGENGMLDARAGAKYEQKATITVAPGGGEVTVTYYNGGAAEARAEAGFGVGEWGENTKGAKVGGHAEAGGEIGGGRGRTVTYRSLDDFIRDCRGESSLTRVGMGSSFLCLGKIAAAGRALIRGVRNFVSWVGLRIHKSVENNAAYRALLRKSGVLGSLDTILGEPPGRGVKTSMKTYDVFKGGFDVGGGMNVNLFTGVDKTTGMENSASVFDLGGKFSYSGEKQLRVHGEEMRMRIDTFRQESDELLETRYRESARRFPDMTLDLDNEGNAMKLFRAMDEKLTALEDEASSYAPADARWTTCCQKLQALSVQYVLVERLMAGLAQAEESLGGESTEGRDLLAAARTNFAERISNPALAIPDDVFAREMMETTSETDNGKTTHKVAFKVDYNVGSDYVKGQVTDHVSSLQAHEGDGFGKAMGRDLGKAALGNTESTVTSQLGLSGSVEGYRTVETPDHDDADRPYRNGKTVTLGIKLDVNMPVRALVETIARKYVDTLADKSEAKVESVMKEVWAVVLPESVVTTVAGATIETFVTEYGKLTLGKALTGEGGKFHEFLGAPLMKALTGQVPLQGLEVGMDFGFSKTIEFKFRSGRLASFAVTDDSKMNSTLGVRFQAGPVGVGVHMKSGFNQSMVERSIYPNPSIDTLLERTADFLRGGEQGKLGLFLAHNRSGSLKAFNSARAAFEPGPEGDAAEIRRRFDEAKEAMRNVAGTARDRSVRDRAREYLAELDVASSVVSRCTDADSEAVRLAALERLLTVMTRSFELLHEANYKNAQH